MVQHRQMDLIASICTSSHTTHRDRNFRLPIDRNEIYHLSPRPHSARPLRRCQRQHHRRLGSSKLQEPASQRAERHREVLQQEQQDGTTLLTLHLIMYSSLTQILVHPHSLGQQRRAHWQCLGQDYWVSSFASTIKVSPSDRAKQLTYSDSNCNPMTYVPWDICFQQFYDICASGNKRGEGSRNFGPGGCQKWIITNPLQA